MIYGAGVDVGSTQTKAVIINEQREIVARSLINTGANVTKAAERSFEEAVATGRPLPVFRALFLVATSLIKA